MYRIQVIILFLFLSYLSNAQEAIFPEPLSARTSNYDISVQLDTENKMVHGKETLYWTNPSTDTVPYIRFHLYLNAFRNTQSTFKKEAGSFFYQPVDPDNL